METLYDVCKNPSGIDSYANYMGAVPPKDLLVVMCRNRDSDILTESNWNAALAILGGESDTEDGDVVIHRFGHWACGWWEALCVRQGTRTEYVGEDIQLRLADYPVLDEDDFSRRECEEANEIWASCYDWHERLQYIREHRSHFDFNGFGDMLECVRGRYFAGYASELIA